MMSYECANLKLINLFRRSRPYITTKAAETLFLKFLTQILLLQKFAPTLWSGSATIRLTQNAEHFGQG
jgi:hypothetical protein